MKNNRIYLILILVFHFGIGCFGQSIYSKQDSAINNFIGQLQRQGVDTICVYQIFYVGGKEIAYAPGGDTSCKHSKFLYDTYFLWKKKGLTCLTLKTNCFNYNTISISDNRLWKFCTANKIKIISEKIRPFEVVALRNGKREMEMVTQDHSGHQNIMLIINKKRRERSLDDFNFEKTTGGTDAEVNINYSYNQNTRIKQLQTLLGRLTNENYKLLERVK